MYWTDAGTDKIQRANLDGTNVQDLVTGLVGLKYITLDSTPLPTPTVVTTTATSMTSNSAQLNGTVNPNGASTAYYFEYGTTTSYGSTTISLNAGSGTSAVPVNSSISGLNTNTTYHYRLVATNSGGTSYGSNLTFTTLALPSIMVTTSPSGRQIVVDGITHTAPQTFTTWTPGSQHTIGVSSPQSGTTGTQYVYSSWSDNGAQTHQITTPSTNTTYTANFTTQYYLTMTAGTGGSVSPSSGWYDSGQNVQIQATPNSGYSFSTWTGSGSGAYTGTNNPATVTMSGPITETTNFTVTPTVYTLTVNSVPTGAVIMVSPADNNGDSNGTTSFTRQYDNGTSVMLTAPSSFSTQKFDHWDLVPCYF